MKKSENVAYYEDREHIDKIINILKKYSYEQLVKREYYEISIMEKNTDEKILKGYYPQFNRIKLIGFRKRESKESNYDIYYELDNGQAILYAIDIDKSPPVLINAFLFNKNLKKFIQAILKKYGKEMI